MIQIERPEEKYIEKGYKLMGYGCVSVSAIVVVILFVLIFLM